VEVRGGDVVRRGGRVGVVVVDGRGHPRQAVVLPALPRRADETRRQADGARFLPVQGVEVGAGYVARLVHARDQVGVAVVAVGNVRGAGSRHDRRHAAAQGHVERAALAAPDGERGPRESEGLALDLRAVLVVVDVLGGVAVVVAAGQGLRIVVPGEVL